MIVGLMIGVVVLTDINRTGDVLLLIFFTHIYLFVKNAAIHYVSERNFVFFFVNKNCLKETFYYLSLTHSYDGFSILS